MFSSSGVLVFGQVKKFAFDSPPSRFRLDIFGERDSNQNHRLWGGGGGGVGFVLSSAYIFL